MMTLMPYLESGSSIQTSSATQLDLDDDQIIENHRQVFKQCHDNFFFKAKWFLSFDNIDKWFREQRTREKSRRARESLVIYEKPRGTRFQPFSLSSFPTVCVHNRRNTAYLNGRPVVLLSRLRARIVKPSMIVFQAPDLILNSVL